MKLRDWEGDVWEWDGEGWYKPSSESWLPDRETLNDVYGPLEEVEDE